MSSTPTNEPTDHPTDASSAYATVATSPDFVALRRTFRRFVFPLAALFLVLYVLLSNYAHGFMSKSVVGNVHVGIIFGLLQFVSTFVITMVYARWADTKFDAKADAVAAQVGAQMTGDMR